MQLMVGLCPREVLAHYPEGEPVLIEILPGKPVALPTWWEMLRCLAALQVGMELGHPVLGLFGFWN